MKRKKLCPCGSGKKYKKCCGKTGNEQVDLTKMPFRIVEPHLPVLPKVISRSDKYSIRQVGLTTHFRPAKETFHEFLIYNLLLVFDHEWRKKQMAISSEKRHVLLNWLKSLNEWKATIFKEENKLSGEEIYSAFPSGDVQALLSFAYDIFCLQTVLRLKSSLVNRLKNFNEFQGARYELLVTAIIIRAGFKISFLDDKVKSSSHCEFIAKHKETGVEIGVEAKSRRRKGILHEKGNFDFETAIRGDVKHLFRKARSQKPNGLPFIIFIDLNMPPREDILNEPRPWITDIKAMIDNYRNETNDNAQPYNACFFTNIVYHYGANKGEHPNSEFLKVVPPYSETPLSDNKVINVIWDSLKRYNYIPREP